MRLFAVSVALWSSGCAARPTVDPPGPPTTMGHPVVLVHGFASAPDIWRGLEPVLVRRGYVPISIAWSPALDAPIEQSLGPGVQRRIREAIAAAGYDPKGPWSAVGHSLGGLVLRQLQLDRPEDLAAPQRVLALASPWLGPRTGIGRTACDTFPDATWRPAVCALLPGAPFLTGLSPESLDERWLLVGSETGAPLLPAVGWDGDGDGRIGGHDDAVAVESAVPAGSRGVRIRGGFFARHFQLTCTEAVAELVLAHLDGRRVDTDTVRGPGQDLCRGRPKKGWRRGVPRAPVDVTR